MNRRSHILALLKHSTSRTTLLNQIFAQSTTAGLLHTAGGGSGAAVILNSIIRAYAKSSSPIQSIFIYNHFFSTASSLLFPDKHTFPALLSACSRLRCFTKGREIHAHVTKVGSAHDVYIQNSLIHLYGVASQISHARQMFDEMHLRDLASWNSILTACVSTPETHWIEALFREMLRSTVVADEISLVVLLSRCKQEELDSHGRMVLHAYGLKIGLVCNCKIGNAIMDIYAKMGDRDSAVRLFEEMGAMGVRDIASHTILINMCIASGSLDSAREIFDRMHARDLVLWNSIINGYIKAKRPKEAVELFKQMEMETLMPDENTMVSVISACASLADLKFGHSVHQFINEKQIKKDSFLQTALVDMYAKCGCLEEAVLLFLKMPHKDVFAWTAVISGFAAHGNGSEALKLFLMMQHEGVEPNEATFVSLLKACSNSGLVNEGQLWFKKMVKNYNIEPKIEHLGCMIDLLSRAGMLSEAKELITEVSERDRIVLYKSLLQACISHGDIFLGEKITEELFRSTAQSYEAYTLISNFYALARRWDDVEELRRRMRSLGRRKEAGTSYVQAVD